MSNTTVGEAVEQNLDIDDTLAVFDSAISDPINKIIFTFENKEDLVILWEDGKVDIKYTGDKMTDVGKSFFDWLTQYIEQTYDLVPKKR